MGGKEGSALKLSALNSEEQKALCPPKTLGILLSKILLKFRHNRIDFSFLRDVSKP